MSSEVEKSQHPKETNTFWGRTFGSSGSGGEHTSYPGSGGGVAPQHATESHVEVTTEHTSYPVSGGGVRKSEPTKQTWCTIGNAVLEALLGSDARSKNGQLPCHRHTKVAIASDANSSSSMTRSRSSVAVQLRGLSTFTALMPPCLRIQMSWKISTSYLTLRKFGSPPG